MRPASSIACLSILLGLAPLAAQDVNPYPRPVLARERAVRWEFAGDLDGWRAVNQCRLRPGAEAMAIDSEGGDPYLHGPRIAIEGPLHLRVRLRASTAGRGQVFWTTQASGHWDETKSAPFDLVHDGAWYEVEIPLEASGTVTCLRLDPGAGPGRVDVDWIEVWRFERHPLEIVSVSTVADRVRFLVANHGRDAIDFEAGGRPWRLGAGATTEAEIEASGSEPLEAVAVEVRPVALAPISRTIFVHRPGSPIDGPVLESAEVVVRLASDGRLARLERRGEAVAFLGPIVHRDGVLPRLAVVEAGERTVRLAGDGIEVALTLAGDELAVSIRADRPCEGPVLRTGLDRSRAVFAGLEYLDPGERSSSDLDIETEERFRFAPDPLDVTIPLMAVARDDLAVSLEWSDPSLQPVFAAPNFFDGSADRRMALRGASIDATIRVHPGNLEDAILEAVRRRGLPDLPAAPRSSEEQAALALAAIRGPLAGEGGWGHCAEPNWGRAPYADFASTIWRLTGEAPRLERLVPGGSHLANDAIWFATGRAAEWLEARRERVRLLLAEQRPDGSFRYDGPYRRGHDADTANGFVAPRAVTLLEFARDTGDERALAGGLLALEFLAKRPTPRGAQTWELSLHTPDILAAAHLVDAYVLGRELTGRPEWLDAARRAAASGLPFVYQWSRHPTMAYATIAVYGATNWRAPNWIGLPVQWCGIVYARALARLAAHDDSLDWVRVARGILLAGERMQYPDGPLAGCLPDVFDLPTQARLGPSINPCALVGLRLVLDGGLDALAVATGGGHRVVAPFPVRIAEGKAVVEARAGARYQVLIDGARVVDVASAGKDEIPLEER